MEGYSNFAKHIGYYLSDWEEGRATISLTLGEEHLNRAGIMHGGVLATLIDTACGFAAGHHPEPEKKRGCVTLSLTTQFLAAGRSGDTLHATARHKGGGKSIRFFTCDVLNQDGQLVGQGEAVMKMMDRK